MRCREAAGSVAAASGVVPSGNGRPIAVPTRGRMVKLPDVPTSYEQGVTDRAFQVQGWIGFVGPAGLPKEIGQKLSDMMVEGGKSARIQIIPATFGIDNAARDHVVFERIVARGGADLDRTGEGSEPRASIAMPRRRAVLG